MSQSPERRAQTGTGISDQKKPSRIATIHDTVVYSTSTCLYYCCCSLTWIQIQGLRCTWNSFDGRERRKRAGSP